MIIIWAIRANHSGLLGEQVHSSFLVFPKKLHFSLLVLEQTWDSQSSRWDVTSMGVVLGVAKADLKYRDDRQIVCGKFIESCMRDRRRLSYKIIACIGYRKMLHVQ